MKIDIAAISLDVENFRHIPTSNERDAIRFLLSDERTHKVTELAQDIVEQKGLDPSSLFIVTENDQHPGQYIALEGNRRITALKTLMTPELAEGSSGHAIFKALHQSFLDLNLSAVECVVLDRGAAATWIKRKHYKGMGGAGVVAWNAVATARSDASEGRFTRWMTALAYLEEHGVDAEDIRDSIAAKTTTVERVLTSLHISTILGLTFDKTGILTPENGDESKAVELIKQLMEAMSDRSFVETKVSNAAQQQAFISQFAALNVKIPPPPVINPPPPASSPVSASPTQGPPNGTPGQTMGRGSSTPGQSTTATPGTKGGSSRSKPVTLRKKLAKSGLPINNQPLNKLYAELRNLDSEKNPHISSAIIRICVEKSSSFFLDVKNVPPLNPTPGSTWHDYGIKFKDKVGSVLKELDPKGTNPEFSYARDIANGNRDKLHTADHLNKAIHSHLALPSHSEIIIIWDRLHPFLLKLYESI